jgi:hypothetical protein
MTHLLRYQIMAALQAGKSIADNLVGYGRKWRPLVSIWCPLR